MTSLEEIKRLLAAATPGPWDWQEDRWNGGYSGLASGSGQEVVYPSCRNEGDWGAAWFDEDGLSEANAQLIAKAPTLIAELIERVERLQKVEAAAKAVEETK